ncbi:MAG: Rieske 2Fe-2S domain-containing protein [SAR202 cluster bacterium]|nr:Rieske 2Fe-2S domain-containing protein [SAR202 cluster bacterium]
MATDVQGLIRVGTLAEVSGRGCSVVTGAGHTIAVFAQGDDLHALDNRCPHMGFPLHQGTLRDGMLTCHWHHARFDVASGNAFDLFAGDVPTFGVRVVNGDVYVQVQPRAGDQAAEWERRLDEGLAHGIRLVIARSVIGLMNAGRDYRRPVTLGAEFAAARASNGWTNAMTILTAAANILPRLFEDDRPRALFAGLLHVAQDAAGAPARVPVPPLNPAVARTDRLAGWLRRFVEVRDNEAAERTLRTAIDAGMSREAVAGMIFSAITDHLYIDGGHTLDYANKAFELLEHIGWRHAPLTLTSLVPRITEASRGEESSSWRHPVDVAAMVYAARAELPALVEQGRKATKRWTGEDRLAETILGDDPAATIDELKHAIAAGAAPDAVAGAVAFAAFLRMARFHLSNEFGDWETVHNTLTAANALHQALRRTPSVDLLRAVFDTAIAVYHDRFLNMPPAAMPAASVGGADGTASMLDELLELLNRQRQVTPAATLVARYFDAGAPDDALLAAMGHALLREDAGFHLFQLVDAAFQQYAPRRGTAQGRAVLVAAIRYMSAHAPTVRSVGQTYDTAFRLHRGDQLFQQDEEG